MERGVIEPRVVQAISAYPQLQEAVALEPGIRILLDFAAVPSTEERWQRYEKLKRAGSRYVGWNAERAELRSSELYQSFIEALDEILEAGDVIE